MCRKLKSIHRVAKVVLAELIEMDAVGAYDHLLKVEIPRRDYNESGVWKWEGLL